MERSQLTELVPGAIDVHAHFVPPTAVDIPVPGGSIHVASSDRAVEVDGLRLPINSPSITDVDVLIADMDANGISVRVLSGPPFTFATTATGGPAHEYAVAYNDGVSSACAAYPGRLVGLGLVPLADPVAAAAEMDRIVDLPWMRGIALPPLVGDSSFDRDPLRAILRAAVDRDLSVLVHPSQINRPELGHHYLANLIGNPTETAVGAASLLLGGVFEELPALRICLLHGGGTTSRLLGRWQHGWEVRADVSADSTAGPREAARNLYIDLLTHDPTEAAHLVHHFADDHVMLGSDYPFDMGVIDPVGFAASAGFGPRPLETNAWAFLGRPTD